MKVRELEMVYEGVEPGQFQNWNYRIEDRDGNVHYVGVTKNPVNRNNTHAHAVRSKKKTLTLIQKRMRDGGIENFQQVYHDGDNMESNAPSLVREREYMEIYKTNRIDYPENPYACNVDGGKDSVFHELPLERQKEISKIRSVTFQKTMKEKWADPEFRERMIPFIMKNLLSTDRSSLEYKRKQKEGMRRYWDTPGSREAKSEQNLKLWKDPRHKEKMRKAGFRKKSYASEEQEDQMYDLVRNQGMTILAAGEKMRLGCKVAKNAFSRSLKRHEGVHTLKEKGINMHRKCTDEEEWEIYKLKKSGTMTTADLNEKMGLDRRSIFTARLARRVEERHGPLEYVEERHEGKP